MKSTINEYNLINFLRDAMTYAREGYLTDELTRDLAQEIGLALLDIINNHTADEEEQAEINLRREANSQASVSGVTPPKANAPGHYNAATDIPL